MKNTQSIKYDGLTKRQYKRKKGQSSLCSTPGSAKGLNCHATPLQKSIAFSNKSYKAKYYLQVIANYLNLAKSKNIYNGSYFHDIIGI